MKSSVAFLRFCGAIFIFYVVDRLIEIVMISVACEHIYYLDIFPIYIFLIVLGLPLSYYFESRKGRSIYFSWLFWPILLEMVLVIEATAKAFFGI